MTESAGNGRAGSSPVVAFTLFRLDPLTMRRPIILATALFVTGCGSVTPGYYTPEGRWVDQQRHGMSGPMADLGAFLGTTDRTRVTVNGQTSTVAVTTYPSGRASVTVRTPK